MEDKLGRDAVSWLDLYGDALYGFAMVRVRDSFAAEDLVQETLLAAYRSYEKFAGKSSVKTWLIGILKHKISDYYRKITPEQNDENLDDFAGSLDNLFDVRERWKVKPGTWGNDPKDEFEYKELLAAISACLIDMSPRLSLVFSMREVEGATTKEICKRFNIQENNCWIILHRARMFLRRCLEMNWFDDGRKRI